MASRLGNDCEPVFQVATRPTRNIVVRESHDWPASPRIQVAHSRHMTVLPWRIRQASKTNTAHAAPSKAVKPGIVSRKEIAGCDGKIVVRCSRPLAPGWTSECHLDAPSTSKRAAQNSSASNTPWARRTGRRHLSTSKSIRTRPPSTWSGVGFGRELSGRPNFGLTSAPPRTTSAE
ncbi:hypothetical protein P280DRAFT_484985 [Massarina eburnea CBS 473.64]|uniref:Uncharacterized protein n=1 Tax=Massarina eburnea CBS 473.64 TaxID=1395130 RepID=A0A6A6RKR6_9PLEO|nr:hypothetical protein P280DRAFT_484985 [Massarina eburnea CBS 473.64]